MDNPWFVDPTEAVNEFVDTFSRVDKVLIKSVLSVSTNSRAIAAAGDAVRIRKVILVESFDNNLRRLPPSPLNPPLFVPVISVTSTMSEGSTLNSNAKLFINAWRNNRDDVNVLSNDVNVTSPMNSPPPDVAVGVVGAVGTVGSEVSVVSIIVEPSGQSID